MKTALKWIVLATLALLAGCARQAGGEAVTPAIGPAVPVGLVTVESATLASVVEVIGTVRPRQRALLAARLQGAVEQVSAKLGERVRAGEPLVRLAQADLAARLAQAQAQEAMLRRDLERERALLAKSVSPADTVRTLEDRLVVAQAVVREAEVMMEFATLRAPFDGVVARRLVEPGDLASPGVPLVEVEGEGDFEIDVPVPESLASGLVRDRELGVQIPGQNTAFRARVVEVSSLAEAGTHSVRVKLAVPAAVVVRSGQTVRVELSLPAVPTLLVPRTAVSWLGQMERVFVADVHGRALMRIVKTGAVRGDRVEVSAGLSEGERVVSAPPAGLREGQALEVKP